MESFIDSLIRLLEAMDPLLQVALGGLLAMLGGIIGLRLQAKQARKIRMDEVTAEKKVNANTEAYSRMKIIELKLRQDTSKNALNTMLKYENWFFGIRLFLPGKFPDKWLSMRNLLIKAVKLEKRIESDTTGEIADQLGTVQTKLSKLAEDAIVEIYNDMDLPRIKLEQ